MSGSAVASKDQEIISKLYDKHKYNTEIKNFLDDLSNKNSLWYYKFFHLKNGNFAIERMKLDSAGNPKYESLQCNIDGSNAHIKKEKINESSFVKMYDDLSNGVNQFGMLPVVAGATIALAGAAWQNRNTLKKAYTNTKDTLANAYSKAQEYLWGAEKKDIQELKALKDDEKILNSSAMN